MPGDWVSSNANKPGPLLRTPWCARPSPATAGTFARLALENPPIARFKPTADTHRFSDVASIEERRGLALYREVYAEIGLEHQIAFVVKGSTDSHAGVVLSRRYSDVARSAWWSWC